MIRRFALALACAALLVPAAAVRAADEPGAGMPTPAEAAFVSSAQKALSTKFATAADAVKAGYVRYTEEDNTGAISYANSKWTSTYPALPSQLWYDAKGNLLGADYSVEKSAYPDGPPAAYNGITNAKRWIQIPAHIHYGIAMPDGTMKYGGIGAKPYADAGGDPMHPTADLVVKILGTRAKNPIVAKPEDVKFAFLYHNIWDLIVWIKPNPDGAFADKNPSVTPSKSSNPNAEH